MTYQTKKAERPVRDDLKPYTKIALNGIGVIAGQVELTSDCFQRCRGCESWRDHATGAHKGLMSLEQLQTLTKDLNADACFEHLSLTGGDPQAWPYLNEYFAWVERSFPDRNWGLQISTALAQDLSEQDMTWWRGSVRNLRVSLDAVDPSIYQKIRGVPQGPALVLRRLQALKHPRLQTLTTVFPENLEHIPAIVSALREAEIRIRKISFIPVLGPRATKDEAYWKTYSEIASHYKGDPQISLGVESMEQVEAWRESNEARSTPCWVGRSTFHMKFNGDIFPCCTVGGEALQTRREFVVGNYFEQQPRPLRLILRDFRHKALSYGNMKACRELCQFKQCAFNAEAEHVARFTQITMP